jgi:hypothetical protein
LRNQNMAARLSVESLIVLCSPTSKHWTAASWWRRLPPSSRSELVASPFRFENDTSPAWMSRGIVSRQTIGRRLSRRCRRSVPSDRRVRTRAARGVTVRSGNQTPPEPRPEASWAPIKEGCVGTSSWSHVGRWLRSLWIQRKSFNESWKPWLSRRRRPCLTRIATWTRELKSPRVPGSAMAMDRSSPKSPYHFSKERRRWVVGIRERSSAKRSTRCWGRVRVMATELMIHPRTFFTVRQEAPPWRSFFTEMG